jgi:hypothetical protein
MAGRSSLIIDVNDDAQRCVQSGGRVHIGHLGGRKDVSNVIGDGLSALALECQKVAMDCDVVNGHAIYASDLLEGRAKSLDVIILEECTDAIVEPTEFFHIRFYFRVRLRLTILNSTGRGVEVTLTAGAMTISIESRLRQPRSWAGGIE